MTLKKRRNGNHKSQPDAPNGRRVVGELYKRFEPQLRFFIARQLRLKHRAEDILADIFMSLLRYPPTEELSRADNYLWKISWRVVNAENRRTQRDKVQMTQFLNDAPDWLVGQSSALAPRDTADWLAFQEQVWQSFEGLGPKERQAVVLARMGYSHKEVAMRMGISVSAVHEYLRRGYAKLKSGSPPEES